MKISMMSYTMARGEWGKHHNIEELCEFTQKLGLDGIDWVSTYGVDPKEIRKIMDGYGLRTVCYTFFADINFSDKRSRQPGLEKIKEGIQIARILGTDKIMLPIPGKDEFSRKESRKNVIEGLQETVPFGKEFGITITVEHFPDWRSPFILSKDVNEALDKIPDLRITYDSGNVLTGGEDPVVGFINSKEAIVHAHFKDWTLSSEGKGKKGLDGRFYIPALVGEGMVNHRAVLQAMKEARYVGYINLEYEGEEYSSEKAMIKGLTCLRSILSELE